MAAIYEIQESLNVLAYGAYPPASGGIRDAQQAANDWAGTTTLDLQAALNCKHYGVTSINAMIAGNHRFMDFNEVCNALNSSTNLDGQWALSKLAGGG